ncbi:MAG TPA: S1/P1 nuclease [Gemmataceae bacterium]|nr:S1/P1 nuclease [Gemmataceae bacterium]
MRQLGIALTVLGLWQLKPAAVAAWHNAGHMTIARIAYQELSEPQRLLAWKWLKAHPHYARYLAADRPKEITEGEWAFMRAATWPDWVRPQRPPRADEEELVKRYHRGVWHYINFPLVLPGSENVKVPPGLPPPDLDVQGEPGHVLAALKKCVTVLRSADASDESKGIFLCWLLHLVGDLHQPLHATTLISKQFPQGDLGGNLFLVSLKQGGPAVGLHFYWDALLFEDNAPFKDIEAKAAQLRRAEEFRRDRLPELKAVDFKAWADESFELARTVVYKNGQLKGARKGKGGEAVKAPLVPEGYQREAARVAERRMVLAGYRIADQLAPILKKP